MTGRLHDIVLHFSLPVMYLHPAGCLQQTIMPFLSDSLNTEGRSVDTAAVTSSPHCLWLWTQLKSSNRLILVQLDRKCLGILHGVIAVCRVWQDLECCKSYPLRIICMVEPTS